jgi:hypothetical protein
MSPARCFALLVFLFSSLFCSTALAQALLGCPMFPADNIWNAPVDTLALDAKSSAYVAAIGATLRGHPDFDAQGGGIPYAVVPGTQTKVAVAFDYADESDAGPYPIPPNPPIEAGSDRHLLTLDRDNCKLYELFDLSRKLDGTWRAGSGAIFDLRSNALRPSGWTSADAAGLPMLPGLVRYDEAAVGEIKHAIRFTAPRTRRAFVWPARHFASASSDPALPPMGQRFRLRANFDLTPISPLGKVIFRAMQKYGVILADNGSSWYFTGAPDTRWPDDALHDDFLSLQGSDFEAVDTSSLMASSDSAGVRSAVALSLVSASPVRLRWNQSGSLTVRLSQIAPAGGAVVALQSALPHVLSLPASVTVPAGASRLSVPLIASAVAAYTSVRLSASVAGVTKSASISVFPSSYPASTAVFQGEDLTTKGDWPGRYGQLGYRIAGSAAPLLPPNFLLTRSGYQSLPWANPTADQRAPYLSASAGTRVAAAWASATTLTIDLIMTDSATRPVALYFLDWDSNARNQTIEVLDAANGRLLDTRALSAFSGGVYFKWNVAGQVRFRVKRVAGVSAVVSGVLVGNSN